jgi:hypothetical protein
MLAGEQLHRARDRLADRSGQSRAHPLWYVCHLTGEYGDRDPAQITQLAQQIRRGNLMHREIVGLRARKCVEVWSEQLTRFAADVHRVYDDDVRGLLFRQEYVKEDVPNRRPDIVHADIGWDGAVAYAILGYGWAESVVAKQHIPTA